MVAFNNVADYRAEQKSGGNYFGQSSGGGAGRGKPAGPAKDENAGGAADTAWNPSGFWPNPLAKRFGGAEGYRPHEFIAALARSPEAQDYNSPEGAASALGTQGVYEGGRAAKRDLGRSTQAQGLGRGFQAQGESDIQQQTARGASETMLGAHLEGQARRFQMAQAMAEALTAGNEARFTDYLAQKQASAAKSAGTKGLFGGLLGGLGAIGGALIGAG